MQKRRIVYTSLLLLLLVFVMIETYYAQREIIYEVQDISWCFTQQQNCTYMYEAVSLSVDNDIFCALYDFEEGVFSQQTSQILLSENSVIDKKNYATLQDEIPENMLQAQPSGFSGLMHHKTCIFENNIVTGSANPTINGLYYNDNVIFTFTNTTFALEYENEIIDMLYKERHDAKELMFTSPKVNGTFYLCNKNCRDVIYTAVNQAQKSIHFAAFTFTDQTIATALMERSYHNVSIHGIIEARSSSSKILDYLAELNVSRDANPKTMHHKFFILDAKRVLVGSYNPTLSANTKNAEILIVLESQEIAQAFIEEWNRMYQMTLAS